MKKDRKKEVRFRESAVRLQLIYFSFQLLNFDDNQFDKMLKLKENFLNILRPVRIVYCLNGGSKLRIK